MTTAAPRPAHAAAPKVVRPPGIVAKTIRATSHQPPATASWPEAIWLLGVVGLRAGQRGRGCSWPDFAAVAARRATRRCWAASNGWPGDGPAAADPRAGGRGLLTPVVFGSLRPAIAVPTRFSQGFDPGQREAVLAHEIAHLAAWDPAWQFLAGLACGLLWWQPLAWWSRRQLRAASEAAADEASLLVPGGPGLLAASLVAVGRRLARSRPLGWISITGDGFRSGLGRRVERLMELRSLGCGPGRVSGHGRGVFAKTLLTVAAALVAISCTAWAQPQAPSLDEGGTTMSVLRTSWRCSLAAAALWVLTGTERHGSRQSPRSAGEAGRRKTGPAAGARAG